MYYWLSNGDKVVFVVEDVELEETTLFVDLNSTNHNFFEYYNVLTISFNIIIFCFGSSFKYAFPTYQKTYCTNVVF
jgi:hypothetical protein